MAKSNRVRILFVEDEDTELFGQLQFSLSTAEPNVQFEVIGVETPEDAIAEFEQNCPNAVVLDLFLGDNPVGLDILGQIRRRWPDVPAILITKNPAKKVEASLFAHRPDDFVVKYRDATSTTPVHKSLMSQTSEEICQSVLKLWKKSQENAHRIATAVLGAKDVFADALKKWGEFRNITGPVYDCGGRSYTIEDLAEHVKKGSELGCEFMQAARECTIEQLLKTDKSSDSIEEKRKLCEKEFGKLKPTHKPDAT